MENSKLEYLVISFFIILVRKYGEFYIDKYDNRIWILTWCAFFFYL